MATYEELKSTVMVEQHASQEWAKATLAWGDAATIWEAAVRKTPSLSEVRARWASAGRSWMSVALAWAPRSDESWLPGNYLWTSWSCYWADVAHRWAIESLNSAVDAGRYPLLALYSLPSADSAVDLASAAVVWAKPQSISERACGG